MPWRRRRVLAAALVPLAGCGSRFGLDGDDEEPRCRTGNPTVTDHAVRMLQQPEDDYEIGPADSEATERSGGCDGAVTTATYRCWVEFAEPVFPETVALRTSDHEGTHTEELSVPFCRMDG